MDNLFLKSVIILAAFSLSFFNYFSHRFSSFFSKHQYKILSFGAGNLIALIFLILIPQTISRVRSVDVFLLLLIGFSVFHVLEKFLYQHNTDKKILYTQLKFLHQIGFFVDHFMIGFILSTTLFFESEFKFLILIPLYIQTISSSFSLDYIDKKAATQFNKLTLSSAPLIGAVVSLALNNKSSIHFHIFAFIIGMLLYIVSRDIMPRKTDGNPLLFIMGIMLVSIIWLFI